MDEARVRSAHALSLGSTPTALVRLLWLVSPALPIGSYAYSRGLEHAVDAGFVVDAASATAWIEGVLARQVATLDAPLLVRLHAAHAARDQAAVARWSALSAALRESAEAALEDRQLGLALLRVLGDAGVLDAGEPSHAPSYVSAFALAAARFEIARDAAVLGYLFAFAEAQVVAASKLVPLGQRAAQRVLAALLPRMEPLAAEALRCSDDEIGAYTPGLALGSALHETQYTRLFRS